MLFARRRFEDDPTALHLDGQKVHQRRDRRPRKSPLAEALDEFEPAQSADDVDGDHSGSGFGIVR